MLTNTLLRTIAVLVFSLISLTSHSESIASPVDTLLTQIESSLHYVTLEAKLEAVKQSTVSAQTQGLVESVNFDINDKVAAGQVLIVINSSQQRASLSQAKATLAQAQALNSDAQAELKRHHSLLAQKTLSQGEFDSSLARANSSAAAVLAAEALVKQAQEHLAYTRITAPYSGIVRQRFVQVGEQVSTGQPVMTGFALQPLRAIVDIPQHLAESLTLQGALSNEPNHNPIYIIANGKQYQGHPLTLFPYADSRYSSIRARITLADLPANSALIPGTWVQVQLPSHEQQGIYLPRSAILQQGEVASIFVKSDNQFALRYVRLGHVQQDGRVVILSGLEAKEQVAIDALAAAKNNAMAKETL